MRINEDYIEDITSDEMVSDEVKASEVLMTPKEFYKKYAPSSTHMVTVEIFVSRDTLHFIPTVKQKFEKILDFYYKEHSEIQIVCVSKTQDSFFEDEYRELEVVFEKPDKPIFYEDDRYNDNSNYEEQIVFKSCIKSMPPNEIKRYLNFSVALINLMNFKSNTISWGYPVVYLSNGEDNFEGVDFNYNDSVVNELPYELVNKQTNFNHNAQKKILDDLDEKIIGTCVRYETFKLIEKWYEEWVNNTKN